MSHLPRAIHFIADAPHFDVHWFGDSVTYAAIGKLGAGRSVDVFQLFQCGLQSSGAHIDGKHDFGTGLLAPSVEISIPTSLVSVLCHARSRRIGRCPRGLCHPPIVGRDEIAAGVTHAGHTKFFD